MLRLFAVAAVSIDTIYTPTTAAVAVAVLVLLIYCPRKAFRQCGFGPFDNSRCIPSRNQIWSKHPHTHTQTPWKWIAKCFAYIVVSLAFSDLIFVVTSSTASEMASHYFVIIILPSNSHPYFREPQASKRPKPEAIRQSWFTLWHHVHRKLWIIRVCSFAMWLFY